MKLLPKKSFLLLSIFLTVSFFSTSFIPIKKYHVKFPTKNSYSIVIDKSNYELYLYDSAEDEIVTYPVVFGNKDLNDKMMEGDRGTPEGIFHISEKKRHKKWDCFIMLDYPNAESIQKFNERKLRGLIPESAKIGGGIGIHGTWPHEDFAVDQFQNWTEGCISTKNNYIEELYALLPIGTRIEIRK